MATTTKCVCVWLDETSDRSRPAWIVSLDTIDAEGRALTTQTLDAMDVGEWEADALDPREAAIESGRDEATERGLPLCLNNEGERPELSRTRLV